MRPRKGTRRHFPQRETRPIKQPVRGHQAEGRAWTVLCDVGQQNSSSSAIIRKTDGGRAGRTGLTHVLGRGEKREVEARESRR